MMESLYLLIPLSVLLAFLIGLVFWWATKSGQFDDLEDEGRRILDDDQAAVKSPPEQSNNARNSSAS